MNAKGLQFYEYMSMLDKRKWLGFFWVLFGVYRPTQEFFTDILSKTQPSACGAKALIQYATATVKRS